MKSKQQQLAKLYAQHFSNPASPLIVDGNCNIIFGEGAQNATLMFIGEAPGRDEDLQQRPFVGRSGQLLNKTLHACGMQREDVFITNIVKTRPINNRTPTEQEIKRSLPVLQQQIEIIKPKVVCTLGASATIALLQKPISISKLHGFAIPVGNFILVPTFHPAYVLRDSNHYQSFLADIKFIIQLVKNIEK